MIKNLFSKRILFDLFLIVLLLLIVLGIFFSQNGEAINSLLRFLRIQQQDSAGVFAKQIRYALSLFALLIGLFSVGVLIFTGFVFLTTAGDPKKIEVARKKYAWVSLIGITFLLLLYFFVLAIKF